MVQEHASGVETELQDVQRRLAEVWPQDSFPQNGEQDAGDIENPSQYGKAAHRLLEQVSKLNEQVGELFTADGRAVGEWNQDMLLKTIMDTRTLSGSSRILNSQVS